MSDQKPGLSEKTLAALKAAARKVASEHEKNGVPIVTWKDGKVTRISSDDEGIDTTGS